MPHSSRFCRKASLVALFFALASPGWALFINNPADSDERFEDGQFTGVAGDDPQANPGFAYGAYDFTGVGWREKIPAGPNFDESAISVTMISDRHFLGATHVVTPVGSQVIFADASGVERIYTVESVEVIAVNDNDTDLYVGTLTEAVDDQIARYDLFGGIPVGQDVLIYGNQRTGNNTINKRVGLQTIGAVDNTSIGGLNDTRWLTSDYLDGGGFSPFDKESYYQGGDSSSPMFVDVNGELQIAGIHSAVFTLLSGDTPVGFRNFDSDVGFYSSQINAIIPEPSTGLLLLGGLSLLAWRRR